MPVFYRLFRSVRSTGFLSHKQFGNREAEEGIRNATAIPNHRSGAQREMSPLVLWDPEA